MTSGASTVNTLANLAGGQLSLTAQGNVKLFINSLAGATTTTAVNAQSVIVGQFNDLETSVAQALGTLGAEVRALDLQTGFLEELRDTTTIGLGNIVMLIWPESQRNLHHNKFNRSYQFKHYRLRTQDLIQFSHCSAVKI